MLYFHGLGMKILCTFLLVLVSAWTAVFARVILQSSKLRLWAKHAAEQTQYHIQPGRIVELSIKGSGS